jgi:putative ABC transport system permease protein
MDAFRTTLLQNPHILSTTFVSRLLGTGVPGTAYLYNKESGTDPLPCQYADVDYDFLNTFQVQLERGRFFSKEFPSDEGAVVLNEAAVNAFFADDPLNKYVVSLDIHDTGRKYKIIGVVKDFNYESLHAAIRPLVLHLRSPRQPASSLTLRITSDDITGTLQFVETVWKKTVDGEAISHSFVDETLARLYLREEKIELISLIFSILAIFIACIGFYGLAAFVTEKRTREIAIRRVLGASSITIIRMLLNEFAGWVLISNVIAWPVAYLVMKNWLNNFAFRINIDLIPFVVAGVATIFIASTTVMFHVLKVSIMNPGESLKHE